MLADGNVEALRPYKHQIATPDPVPQYLRAQRQRIAAATRARHDPEAVWFAMSESTRMVLLSLCTDRSTDRAHVIKWSQLTDAERDAIRLQRKAWARDCAGVL